MWNVGQEEAGSGRGWCILNLNPPSFVVICTSPFTFFLLSKISKNLFELIQMYITSDLFN